VRVKPLGAVGAVTFFASFVLLPAAPTHAEWPSIQPPAGPSSGIAQKLLNALRNPGAHHHRTVSLPPLPRPRPADLPRESVELNKAAPEVAPTSEAPKPVQASKLPEGGPAPKSETLDADRTPAESAAIHSAKASAEATAPVEADEAPAAEPAPVSGSNKATPELPPAVSNKREEAAAPVPIND
jgi:hypothetical protein